MERQTSLRKRSKVTERVARLRAVSVARAASEAKAAVRGAV